MTELTKCFKIALLQLPVVADKTKNVEYAIKKIRQVVIEHKPKIVALPECFNCPYNTKNFAEYSETIPNGFTCLNLSNISKELGIYLIGGSIPERDGSNIYNTCTVWSPEGKLMAKHRKIHLYNVEVREGIKFQETDGFVAGKDFTIVEIEGIKIGIFICHDIRFEEIARLYRNEGCKMLVYPAAFDMRTGVLHWELLQRSRANDNQLYVATISVARDEGADYVSWGHSMVVDPWGRVIQSAKEKEEIVIADIDFSLVDEVRRQIPIFSQRRTDLYETVRKTKS